MNNLNWDKLYSTFQNLWNTCKLLLLRHMSFLRVGENVHWLQREHYLEQLCTAEHCVMVEVFYICIDQSPVSWKRLKWLSFTWEGLRMHHKVCAVSGKWVRFRRTRAFQVPKVIEQSWKIGRLTCVEALCAWDAAEKWEWGWNYERSQVPH